MGRLENIIARHQESKKLTSRRVVIYSVFVLVVVTVILMQCTNLGMPKPLPPQPPPPKADRVDGIYLGVPDSHRVKASGGVQRQATPASPTH
ncbi:MAG TPA: hypothetical protein VFQ65_34620 [Kofleriaceae bacterium]|nr:hypothetical protein [Kofleriaceae bacterium]